MTLQEQVCTLEQAKRLKELGCEQESLYAWLRFDGQWFLYENTYWYRAACDGYVSAYTVAELGEMLVCYQDSDGKGYDILHEIDVQLRIEQGFDWWFSINANVFAFPTEAQVRAALLIHKLETRKELQ